MKHQTLAEKSRKKKNALALGRRSSKQGGFGALEVLIALVIGMFIVIAAVGWMTKLSDTANNNDELSNVSTMITNVRTLKTSSGYGPAGTDLIPIMIKAGGIPDIMQRTDTTVSNVWEGAVTMESNGADVTLTYADIPEASCIFLATKAAGSQSLTTSINGGAAIIGEVTAVDASTSCSEDENTLAWTGR